MSILTNRELDFLASLRTDWRRLYWNELARLLREDDTPCDARHGVPSIAPPSGRAKDFIPNYVRSLLPSSEEQDGSRSGGPQA
jgi:hypothetical protein